MSSSSWAIIDKQNGELLFAKCENEQRQVASLTKIMTAYVVIGIISRYKMNEHETFVRVLPSAVKLIGTSASLIAGDILSVWELLHGMMLPSGNDAAQSLAIHFGVFLLKEKFKQLYKNIDSNDANVELVLRTSLSNFECLEENQDVVSLALKEFFNLMNREAMFLKLNNSHF